jgi:predicted alpha/beta hydrolase
MPFKTHEIEFSCQFDGKQNSRSAKACNDITSVISVIEPTNAETIILSVPAMGVAAKQYKQFSYELAELGFIAACFDLRGHGRSSIRASRANNFGYAEIAEVDLPAAIKTMRHHYPRHKLVLLGHSLGGQACSLMLSQNQSQVETLVLAASCSVYYKSWPSPYRWGLLLFAQTSWLISAIVGYFPGRRLGFGGREARAVMRDWAYNARTGDYCLSNSRYNYVPFPPVPRLSVLAINFADDKLAPVLATDHLLSKLSAGKVTKTLITGDNIGRKTADHFNWLRSPKGVAQVIADHLK